ncbi:MAG: hypothetical protein ACKPGT_00645, partial [Microcystis sp.]
MTAHLHQLNIIQRIGPNGTAICDVLNFFVPDLKSSSARPLIPDHTSFAVRILLALSISRGACGSDLCGQSFALWFLARGCSQGYPMSLHMTSRNSTARRV